MIGALNDIKQGLIINYEGEPFMVVGANFMRKSQGKPVMQTKMKSLLTDKTLEISFKPGDKVEEADVKRRPAQFLYTGATDVNFMNEETFEQFTLPLNGLEDKIVFLKEGEKIDVVFFDDKPLTLQLPIKVMLTVSETPDGAKGDSAQGRVTKVATMENGLKVNVPLFIKEGDIIKVNTESGDYIERVSK
jgi:elongation factor P